MSKFYGQVSGASNTTASRRGHQDIAVSAQSWNGSLQTRLFYNNDNELMVDLSYSPDSSFYGKTIFNGKMEDLLKAIEVGKAWI